MRLAALAAVTGLFVAATAAPAFANPWTDPSGKLTFNLPARWETENRNCGECIFVLAFSPSKDCYVYANPRSADQMLQPHRVRAIVTDPAVLTPTVMTTNANAFADVFPDNSATYVSSEVEQTGFWPILRMTFTNGEGATRFGAMQLRKDMEIWAFCQVYSGTDSAAANDAFFRSIGTPTDAAQQAEIEAAEAAHAAAAAAPPPPPPPPPAHNRHRDDN